MSRRVIPRRASHAPAAPEADRARSRRVARFALCAPFADGVRPARRGSASVRACVAILLALLASGGASAQYTNDGPEDLQKGSGVRYFGSARDERGARLADVSFLFEAPQASFVFVTDAGGRFRGLLPLATVKQTVTAKCWKAGLETVRVERRAGPDPTRPSMQVDCVLRRAATR